MAAMDLDDAQTVVARQASVSWTVLLFAAPWLSLTSLLLVFGAPFGRAIVVPVFFYAVFAQRK